MVGKLNAEKKREREKRDRKDSARTNVIKAPTPPMHGWWNLPFQTTEIQEIPSERGEIIKILHLHNVWKVSAVLETMQSDGTLSAWSDRAFRRKTNSLSNCPQSPR